MCTVNPLLFFLLPTRGWEFIIGSITFYVEKKKYFTNKFFFEFLPLLGFFLIIFSVFFFDKETFNPSYLTLLPTIGASLIILSFSKNNFVNKILSNKILVSLGIISCSSYLWHYPIFALAKLKLMVFDFFSYFLILLTLAMSLVSWRIVKCHLEIKIKLKENVSFGFPHVFNLNYISGIKFSPNFYYNSLNDKQKYNFNLINDILIIIMKRQSLIILNVI